MKIRHPDALDPNNPKTGAWQMIYPKKVKGCSLLQDSPIDAAVGVPKDPLLASENGSYLYNVWRRYQCCPRPSKSGKKVFLGRVEARVKIL